MEFKYELTLDDLVDFNMYHTANSLTIKRALLLQRTIAPVIFLIMPFIIRLLDPNSLWFFMSYFVVLSILWIVFYPRYFKRRIRMGVIKVLKEGENPGVVGMQTLVISPDDIIETNELKETRFKWATVQKVGRTDKNILIFTSAVSALIIPLRSFDNKEKAEEFIQMAQKYQQYSSDKSNNKDRKAKSYE